LIIRAGAERVEVTGITKNISSSGVLFSSAAAPSLGGAIEYLITLHDAGPQPVTLRCVGKVLRYARTSDNGHAPSAFEVAATLERYEFVRPN
jgi:hypothetical protein